MTWRFAAIGGFLDALPRLYKIAGIGITIIGAALAVSGSIRAGLQVPQKLDRHIEQEDSVIAALNAQRVILREQLCVTITPRAEWPTRCFANIP